MRILADSCIALLASVGIWTIIKLLICRFFPDENIKGIVSIVCLSGDAYNADLLLSKSYKKYPDTFLILVDCGLTLEGKEYIINQIRTRSRVLFSTLDNLEANVKEAVKWTIQNS